MTLETELATLLRTVGAGNVFQGAAPLSTPGDYLIWRRIGGASNTYLEGGVTNLRNALVRVEAWSPAPERADELILAVEAAIVAWRGTPTGESQQDGDEALHLHSAFQDFSIWAPR